MHRQIVGAIPHQCVQPFSTYNLRSIPRSQHIILRPRQLKPIISLSSCYIKLRVAPNPCASPCIHHSNGVIAASSIDIPLITTPLDVPCLNHIIPHAPLDPHCPNILATACACSDRIVPVTSPQCHNSRGIGLAAVKTYTVITRPSIKHGTRRSIQRTRLLHKHIVALPSRQCIPPPASIERIRSAITFQQIILCITK